MARKELYNADYLLALFFFALHDVLHSLFVKYISVEICYRR